MQTVCRFSSLEITIIQLLWTLEKQGPWFQYRTILSLLYYSTFYYYYFLTDALSHIITSGLHSAVLNVPLWSWVATFWWQNASSSGRWDRMRVTASPSDSRLGLNVHVYMLLPWQTNLHQTAGQSWLVAGPRGMSFLILAALNSPGKMQAQQEHTLRPVTCCNLCVQNDNAHWVVKSNLKGPLQGKGRTKRYRFPQRRLH